MNELNQDIWVTVIIVCHNDGKWLSRCLQSLRDQTIAEHIEVIIADNASADGSDRVAQELIADWDQATFLPTGGDNGFCYAHNRGAEVARGKYLYLFSPDTWLEPDCLEQLYANVEREQAAGAGTLILEYEDDTVQAKGSDGFDLFGNPVSARAGRDPQPLFCIAGFYFIRRDIFLKLGMLDENFFMYGEEMDLSWRVWIAGERLIPVMSARVHHRGAAGVNPAGGTRAVENRTSTQKRFLANRNFLLVISKNGQHLLRLMLLPCLGLILLEGLITLVVSRNLALVKAVCWDALVSFWKLRGQVRERRRQIKAFRRRSDFWMLRFFRFGFGRWVEVKNILERGFPKFTRS